MVRRDVVAPMLATASRLPTSATERQFAYEMKWDGIRIVTYVEDQSVTALSRNLLDVTARYPELTELEGGRCILDGEVVAMDEKGHVSFEALQQRMHIDTSRGIPNVPVAYLVFDVLEVDGARTLHLPYEARRGILSELSVESEHIHVPENFLSTATEAFDTSKELQLEGIVAKRLTSRYVPGIRSRDWIKVKHVHTQEVVIGGWRPGRGNRSGTIGSLLMGLPTQEGLRYVGHVGTGFSESTLFDLATRLAALETSQNPFVNRLDPKDARDAQWVRPELVGEVEYTQWTRAGRLRAPTWRGLRLDKTPGDVLPPSTLSSTATAPASSSPATSTAPATSASATSSSVISRKLTP